MNTPTQPESPPLLVACLCAQWCGTCRDYQAVFDALKAEFAEQVHFVWVDIEDEAERVGPVEVEDFPTLLIAQGGDVRFFGPLLPHAQTLRQTVERALGGPLMRTHDSALAALSLRLAEAVNQPPGLTHRPG